jgi:hypothetical protein
MSQHTNALSVEESAIIRQRTKKYQHKPLFLNGVDPAKFIENARGKDLKPYMTVYFNNALQTKKEPTARSDKFSRRNIQIKRKSTSALTGGDQA